jgi:dihydroorotate dehydrogenase
MLAAGASMVQLYTALIYEGPGLVASINRELVSFMDAHGCATLQDAASEWLERRKVA